VRSRRIAPPLGDDLGGVLPAHDRNAARAAGRVERKYLH